MKSIMTFFRKNLVPVINLIKDQKYDEKEQKAVKKSKER